MQSNKTQTSNLQDLFGFRGTSGIIQAMFPKSENPYIPKFIPTFKFEKEITRDVLFLINNPDPNFGLWIAGPKGCAKTTTPMMVASKLNIPVMRVQGHEDLEVHELVGKLIPNGQGGFDFLEGPLTIAVEKGYLFILDEAGQVPPHVAVWLNAVLEGQPYVLEGDGSRLVSIHPDFRFIATSNSNGMGDQTGHYSGEQVMNSAFMDRFIVVEKDYAPKKEEIGILKSTCPSLTDEICERMVDYANTVRSLFKGSFRQPKGYDEVNLESSSINNTLSTRALCHWGKLMEAFENAPSPYLYGLERVLLNKCESHEKMALKQLAKAMMEGNKS